MRLQDDGFLIRVINGIYLNIFTLAISELSKLDFYGIQLALYCLRLNDLPAA